VRPAVQQLVGGAKKASGRDNITAVLALVENPAAEAVVAEAGLWRRLLRR
jgi:hypothetical protein